MKTKGALYEVALGEWTYWPTTQEDAQRLGISMFSPYPWQFCPSCQSQNFYTASGECVGCVRIKASAAFNDAVQDGAPINEIDANSREIDHYWRPEPGAHCGHLGKRVIKGGCYFCWEEKQLNPASPRQASLDAGESWYMPIDGDVCRKGHHAPRRVANGSCRACEEARRITDSAVRIDQTSPDLILGRAAAQAMGFTVYRTGKPCKRRHTGWRWVSNSGCLECMKGV